MSAAVSDSFQSFRVQILIVAVMGLVIAATPVLLDKTLPNIDRDTHIRWIAQIGDAMQSGIMYPRWLTDSYGGLGELAYAAYPLYWLLAGGLTALGFDPWVAIQCLAVVGIIAPGFLAVPLVANKELAHHDRILVYLAVLTAPLAFFLFSHHAAYPWHLSLSIALCLVILSFASTRPAHWPLSLALVTMLLVLAHVLVAMMVLLSVGAVMLFRIVSSLRSGQKTSHERLWFTAITVGVMGSAFHLLPALAARDLINPLIAQSSIYLDWRNSFTFPLITGPLFGYRWFSVQWVHPSVTLLSLIAIVYAAKTGALTAGARGRALMFAGVAAVALFMSSDLAYLLYDKFVQLRAVQWPYRFATVAGTVSAFALAVALTGCQRQSMGKMALVSALVLQCCLLAALQYQVVNGGSAPASATKLRSKIFFQSGNEPGVLRPGWREYVDQGGMQGECVRARVVCRTVTMTAHRRQYEIRNDEKTTLRLPMFANPAWKVSFNGTQMTPDIDPASGLFSIVLPVTEVNRVQLEFQGLPQEQQGRLISWFALALSIVFLAYLGFRRLGHVGKWKQRN